MIERLLIQNFQAHGKLRVDFDPAITTIVGPSDVGKSAIIRALRWVCCNRPGGDAFVRHGTKGATVKLLVDGHTITRRRTPGGAVNEYKLDDETYRAFGVGVPDPITELLNLGPVTWQLQHDAPYWFSDTAGEVSRQLNSIVNLGIIDRALANVAKAHHRARTKLETAEEDLTEANATFKGLAWVPTFAEAVGVVEAVEAAHTLAARRAADVALLTTKAQRHRKRLDNATGAAQAGENVVTAGGAGILARKRALALENLIKKARDATTAAAAPVPVVEPMALAWKEYKAAKRQRVMLKLILDDIRSKKAAAAKADEARRAAEKEVPDRCPTCGGSLSQTSTYRHERP